METPPNAQIAYLRLASRMRPPRPPVEALEALYAAINRELDKLPEARLDGRPVTTITSWQRAYDDLIEQVGGLSSVLETMHQRRATAPTLEWDSLLAEGRNRRDAVNRILGAFTQPDEAANYFQRGGRVLPKTGNPVGDSAVLTRDLVTRRNIDQLTAQITREPDPKKKAALYTKLKAEARRLVPGSRGADAKGLGFAAHFDPPTVAKVYEAILKELAAWKKKHPRCAFPYVWDKCLSSDKERPNVVEGKGKQLQTPPPSEVACRLIASVLDTTGSLKVRGHAAIGWKKVKAAVNQHRRG